MIDGHHFPADTPVAFITWFANRDPDVFSSPTSFIPERWEEK